MTKLRLAVLPLLVSLAFLGACTDEEENLSTTEQGITFSTQQFFNCATQSCVHVPLGSANDLTCVLAGVTGHLDGTNGVSPSVTIFVNASNQWELMVYSPVQQVVVTCMSAVQNRVFGHTSPMAPDVDLGLATSHRRCFLTGLWIYGAGTPSYSDTLHVYQSRGHWFVGTTVDPAHSEAFGVCVDVPSFVGTFAYGHNASGSFTGPLVPSYHTNNACGLSSLNGNFGYPTDGPPYPGVRIYELPDWVWTFNEHVGAEATCVSGTP